MRTTILLPNETPPTFKKGTALNHVIPGHSLLLQITIILQNDLQTRLFDNKYYFIGKININQYLIHITLFNFHCGPSAN